MKKIAILTIIVVIAVCAGAGWYAANKLSWRTNPATTDGKILHTDLAGRKVWISKNVKRIALLRSKDIYLLASLLGEELPAKLVAWGPDLKMDDVQVYERLVARFPKLRDITITGSVYTDSLNVEQLAQLQLDLVIADKFMLDRGYRYIEKLNAAGLPVVYLDGSTDPLTGPQNGILLLGKVLGKEERSRAIAGFINDQIRQTVSRIESHAPRPPSVYLEAGHLGPQGYGQCYGYVGTSKRQTSWGAILQALKVRNIADGRVVGMAPINPEALLKADPDIIVITGQNWSRWKAPGSMQLGYDVSVADARRLLRGFTERPGWNLLSAVKNRKLYSVFHNTVSPTIFSGIHALAKYCYPGLFGDTNPEKNLREFYDLFMPIAYDGTWMCSLE
ncbi:MAG: ABC transporter substrate-binding protein [Verrucomicrobia bacterium]|nr:ABC transporter substrate-binding protein [Verrucomicrobiota bacterium]